MGVLSVDRKATHHAPQRKPLYYQEQITRCCLCWSPSALFEAPSSLHGDAQWFLRTDLQPMQLLRARVAEAVAVLSLCVIKLAVVCQTLLPAWLSDCFDAQVR